MRKPFFRSSMSCEFGVWCVAIFLAAVFIAMLHFGSGVLEWAGFIGSIASIVGLPIAVWQITDAKHIARQARDASRAALDAATATKREMRFGFYRHALTKAIRLLSDINNFIGSRKWNPAALRAADLAEQVLELSAVGPKADAQYIQFAQSLNQWSLILYRLKKNTDWDNYNKEWGDFHSKLQRKITEEIDPFGDTPAGGPE